MLPYTEFINTLQLTPYIIELKESDTRDGEPPRHYSFEVEANTELLYFFQIAVRSITSHSINIISIIDKNTNENVFQSIIDNLDNFVASSDETLLSYYYQLHYAVAEIEYGDESTRNENIDLELFESDFRHFTFGSRVLDTFLEHTNSEYQIQFDINMPDDSVRNMCINVDNKKQYMIIQDIIDSSEECWNINLIDIYDTTHFISVDADELYDLCPPIHTEDDLRTFNADILNDDLKTAILKLCTNYRQCTGRPFVYFSIEYFRYIHNFNLVALVLGLPHYLPHEDEDEDEDEDIKKQFIGLKLDDDEQIKDSLGSLP